MNPPNCPCENGPSPTGGPDPLEVGQARKGRHWAGQNRLAAGSVAHQEARGRDPELGAEAGWSQLVTVLLRDGVDGWDAEAQGRHYFEK